jgi:chromosome segregation ATPase
MGLGAGLVLAAGLFSCDTAGKGDVVSLQSPLKVNQQALDEQIAKAKAQQQAFAAEGREHLATLDRKIDELKARATESSDQAKQAADDALAKLKDERASASAALERAQSASAESWESVKDGAKQAMERAESAYNQALEKLKRD